MRMVPRQEGAPRPRKEPRKARHSTWKERFGAGRRVVVEMGSQEGTDEVPSTPENGIYSFAVAGLAEGVC